MTLSSPSGYFSSNMYKTVLGHWDAIPALNSIWQSCCQDKHKILFWLLVVTSVVSEKLCLTSDHCYIIPPHQGRLNTFTYWAYPPSSNKRVPSSATRYVLAASLASWFHVCFLLASSWRRHLMTVCLRSKIGSCEPVSLFIILVRRLSGQCNLSWFY